MSCYFEKRSYSRNQIAEILELDPQDKKFSRSVKSKLANLGFTEEQFIYTSKDVTILWVPQTYEEKVTYLVRLLGVDKQVDPVAFATFIYHLALNGDYECNKMPWVEKASWLARHENIQISERTLRSWTQKLIDKGILSKTPADYQLWCSIRVDDKIVRYPVVSPTDIAEHEEYVQFCKNRAAAICDDIAVKNDFVYASAWNEFHKVYYRCSSIAFCAWENNPIMRELRELILEHMRNPGQSSQT